MVSRKESQNVQIVSALDGPLFLALVAERQDLRGVMMMAQ
jgi:hypothetical protein